MKIEYNEKIEISDYSVESILNLLSSRGISPANAIIEKEVNHEYDSYGDDFATAQVYLTFTEEYDGKKFASLVKIDEPLREWEFSKLVRLGSLISGLTIPALAEKLEVSPQTIESWFSGHFPYGKAREILIKLSEVILKIEG